MTFKEAIEKWDELNKGHFHTIDVKITTLNNGEKKYLFRLYRHNDSSFESKVSFEEAFVKAAGPPVVSLDDLKLEEIPGEAKEGGES